MTDIYALLARLHHPDDSTRWQATEQLAELGAPVVDYVLEDVAHSLLDEKLRQSCLFVLEHESDPATVRRIQPVLDALHGLAFRTQAPLAAEHALQAHAHR